LWKFFLREFMGFVNSFFVELCFRYRFVDCNNVFDSQYELNRGYLY